MAQLSTQPKGKGAGILRSLDCWQRHALPFPEDSFDYLEDESLQDIMNATLGFHKIFVLNLPFRTDRRDAMSLSAAISNIKLEYVEGVTGDSIKESAYPPPQENIKLLAAFILEDDVDWDVRVRQNLQRFALASRFLSSCNEHFKNSPNLKNHIDYRPSTETEEMAFKSIDNRNVPHTLASLPLASVSDSRNPPQRHGLEAHMSPYGDPKTWDILWLGHCGAGLPRDSQRRSSSLKHRPPATASNLILTYANDSTVPVGRYLKAHPFQGYQDAFSTAFPSHTRIYHRSTGGELCTVGYAVSQRGARRLLHQFGLKGWNGIFDSELGRWCAGEDPNMGPDYPQPAHGAHEKERVCMTTQPPIFAHHHPMQGESDIGGLGGGYARKYETPFLRYSVRMNLENLVQGKGERDLTDQWPDQEE
ncbi:hypothetical protein EK21DRAFT_100696 [Setomelanomma holmii]|uniref:Uncharacterized protein n=1 Tax=Setomelanomma holmii TaxID=210430 RepID=A0A9P4HBL0_9PLEO|nr:hypothetical protein EK21DRAFT_100696 [Setomelanomma holmii]